MSVFLFLIVACSSGPSEEQATVAPKSTVSKEAPPSASKKSSKKSSKEASKEASKKSNKEASKPAGSIGGVPILPNPIVLGALDPKKVDAAIDQQRAAIGNCYTQATKQARAEQKSIPMGKVLVKFTIDNTGAVTKVGTKSTSLRHEPTEKCVNEIIAKAQFPAPEKGGKAIISYPFAFPQ